MQRSEELTKPAKTNSETHTDRLFMALMDGIIEAL